MFLWEMLYIMCQSPLDLTPSMTSPNKGLAVSQIHVEVSTKPPPHRTTEFTDEDPPHY